MGSFEEIQLVINVVWNGRVNISTVLFLCSLKGQLIKVWECSLTIKYWNYTSSKNKIHGIPSK